MHNSDVLKTAGINITDNRIDLKPPKNKNNTILSIFDN